MCDELRDEFRQTPAGVPCFRRTYQCFLPMMHRKGAPVAWCTLWCQLLEPRGLGGKTTLRCVEICMPCVACEGAWTSLHDRPCPSRHLPRQ